jgi:hypothetical protein
MKPNPYIFARPKETQPKNLTAPRTKLKRAPEVLKTAHYATKATDGSSQDEAEEQQT